MKVCVMGGAGYIGSHAVLELLKHGNEVVVIDNLSTGNEKNILEGSEFYIGDITVKEDLVNIFKKECSEKTFDVIMHFAGKLVVPESVTNPLAYYFNNVEGVRIMLEVMTEFNVKNVVFSSTAAVYGVPSKEVCEEDDYLIPINPYGETKLACEKLLKWVAEAHNLNYGIFRYFNVAGADESLKVGYNYDKEVITHLIPIVAEVALGIRDKLKIYGDDYNTSDGTCIRDYLHVSDLARAHILGAKYLIENNKSFTINLGSNNGFSVKQIVEETNKIKKIDYVIEPRREGDPDKLIASNKKAKEIIDWKPKYTLEDIITSEIRYRQIFRKKQM